MSTHGQRGQTPREALKHNFTGAHPRPNGRANGHAHYSPRFPFDQAEAKRFLSLLDGEAGAFLFAAGDDDKERKKRLIAEAKAASRLKPVLWLHRRDSVERVGTWIEEQQEGGWGAFVSVQAMKAAKCQIGELDLHSRRLRRDGHR